jgi:two-component system chemotaxis response regulator CheB
MDINLPGIDGITALQYIIQENICPVVMVSSLTQEGAMLTFEALELGAFDYVPKPGGTISHNIRDVGKDIIAKVKEAARYSKLSRVQKRMNSIRESYSPKTNTKSIHKSVNVVIPSNKIVNKAVAIGISTGGPKALSEIIPEIPENLGAALFIVQHMPANFTKSFATRLNDHAKIHIKEAEAGETVYENWGYVGKGGSHLQLKKRPNGEVNVRFNEDIEHYFKPSVGVMMESVLSVFGKNTIGVIMTGMGDDGADAMLKIRNAGGITIAESEETAVVFGMPKEAIDRGGAEIVVPSYKIVSEILKAIKRLG